MLFLSIPFLLASALVFVLDSCKKTQHDNSDSGIAAKQFFDALKANKSQIESIALHKNNTNMMLRTNNVMTEENLYLDFPTGTDPLIIAEFDNGSNIQGISNVLATYNVVVQDTADGNTEVILQLPVEQITTSLQPLVIASKTYLIAKGFTTQSINDMIQEEGVTELELIPFVKALASIELNQYAINKFNIPFVNSTQALPHYLECGLAALGADALYSLALSGASSWTFAAMRTAFTGVARRFLGPIGVAVAVVSFGICMLN